MKKVLKYSFCFFFKGEGGKGTTFMLVILAVSYFAHIVIKFKLLFSEYKCLDHSGIYTRKNGGAHSKHTKHFQSLKDTKTLLGLLHTLKCLVFFMFYRHSGLFSFAGKVRSKNKNVERIIAFRANLSKLW